MLFLDKTSLYAESGGQVGDKGEIVTQSGSVFVVTDCQRINRSPKHVAHIGKVKKGSFKIGEEVKVKLNVPHRIACMQNHTATHLLNAVLHERLPWTCQKSSYVGPSHFTFDFSAFNVDMDLDFLISIEEDIHKLIEKNSPIQRKHILRSELEKESKLITIPGEHYPSELSIIQTPSGSSEPCCGTHVFNAGDIESFAIIGVKSHRYGIKSMTCLTGMRAIDARKQGLKHIEQVYSMVESAEKVNSETPEPELKSIIDKMRKKKGVMLDKNRTPYPYTVNVTMIDILNAHLKHCMSFGRETTKNSMREEMEKVLANNSEEPFVTHFIDLTDSKKVLLSKVTSLCKVKPILLLAKAENLFYGRACVPKLFANDEFNAIKWIELVTELVGSSAAPPRGQDPHLVCNLSPMKDGAEKVTDDMIASALMAANDFAQSHVKKL